jgi:hypothetical protein
MLSNKDTNWTVQCPNIVPKRQIGPVGEDRFLKKRVEAGMS